MNNSTLRHRCFFRRALWGGWQGITKGNGAEVAKRRAPQPLPERFTAGEFQVSKSFTLTHLSDLARQMSSKSGIRLPR